jgi:hypothetical protein
VRKVTSEVSVSQRRRSPSAAVSAWTEAESAREEASLAQEHVASLAEEVQQRRLEPGQIVH